MAAWRLCGQATPRHARNVVVVINLARPARRKIDAVGIVSKKCDMLLLSLCGELMAYEIVVASLAVWLRKSG